MKLSFIDVRYKHPVEVPDDFIDKLPDKIVLFLNIQFHDQYEQIKNQLEAKGKIVLTVRPKHAWHEGQILGCSVEEWDEGQDAFVYIGDGLFHPKAILFNNEQKVFLFDPKTKEQKTLTKQDIEQIEKQRRGAMASFYAAQKVGVLITTKYGQSRLHEALKLKEKYPDKEFFFLMADVIDFNKLEDFPFIDCYVNTACPRIMDDNEKVPRALVNIGDLGVEW